MEPIYFNSSIEEWSWLSNFHPAVVEHEGLSYLNVEAAYQASKSSDPWVRKQFQNLSGWAAKKRGAAIKLDVPWTERDRLMLMDNLILQKFSRHAYLKGKLLATVGRRLIERADHDGFWGDGRDRLGHNYTGRILEKTRTVLAG